MRLFFTRITAGVCSLIFVSTFAAAAVFHSDLKFTVYLVASPDNPDRIVGSTPGTVTIPDDGEGLWYVRPRGTLDAMGLQTVANEILARKIPGLDLSRRFDLTDSDMSVLASLRQLKALKLSETRLTDQTLAFIPKLTKLRILSLNRTMTDAGMPYLQNLKNLERLNLRKTRVTDEGIAFIAPLQKLVDLNLSDTSISSKGLNQLAFLPSLQFLTLGGGIDNRAGSYLLLFPNVVELDLSQTMFTDSGLRFLPQLSKLQSLYLNRFVSDAGLPTLAKIKTLKRLDLSKATLTSGSLTWLSNLPALEELALSDTSLNDAALPNIAKLQKLKTLEISGTAITSAGLYFLREMPHLETLSVEWPQLTKKDLSGLVYLPQLRTLILDGSRVPDEKLAEFKSLALTEGWQQRNPYFLGAMPGPKGPLKMAAGAASMPRMDLPTTVPFTPKPRTTMPLPKPALLEAAAPLKAEVDPELAIETATLSQQPRASGKWRGPSIQPVATNSHDLSVPAASRAPQTVLKAPAHPSVLRTRQAAEAASHLPALNTTSFIEVAELPGRSSAASLTAPLVPGASPVLMTSNDNKQGTHLRNVGLRRIAYAKQETWDLEEPHSAAVVSIIPTFEANRRNRLGEYSVSVAPPKRR